MKTIFAALKEVLFSRNPARCMLESMMKWDFKVGDQRQNLMQLCFANLASWPVFVLALLVIFDPFKHSFSLAGVFGDENRFVHILLDGHTQNLILFFSFFFVLEWLFRIEFLLIGLLLYFLNKGDLHVSVAVISVFAVYLARICYLWWLAVDCESEARKIWNRVGLMHLMAWVVVLAATLYELDFMLINRLFDGIFSGRLIFVTLSIAIFQLLAHVLLSIWGHFYFKTLPDPSDLRTSYSTGNWILRFGMTVRTQNILKKQIELQLPKHQQSFEQYNELKGHSPGLSKLAVESVLRKEIDYLKEALLRLNRI
jgi:hypothetical protein